MLLVSKKIKTSDDSGSEQINVRLPSALLDLLDRIGEPVGVKRSHLIKQAIIEYVQRNRGTIENDPKNQHAR
jgi:metal-responsive CopG/Arc/MetJ family transcriptional regulator